MATGWWAHGLTNDLETSGWKPKDSQGNWHATALAHTHLSETGHQIKCLKKNFSSEYVRFRGCQNPTLKTVQLSLYRTIITLILSNYHYHLSLIDRSVIFNLQLNIILRGSRGSCLFRCEALKILVPTSLTQWQQPKGSQSELALWNL